MKDKLTGKQVNGNYGANPNYPSSYRELTYNKFSPTNEHEKWSGAAVLNLPEITAEDYVQATGLWNVLGKQPGQQE